MNDRAATNIIKSSRTKKGGVLKHHTMAAKAEAEEIIAGADAYAAKVVEEADLKAEAAYRNAAAKGEADSLLRFEENIVAALELRENAMREAERNLLRLSVKLAEKIVGRELKTDRETVVDIINTALQHARQKENLVIRVNPSDLAIAEQELEMFKFSSRSKFIDISPDPRVDQGGCLIESEVGTVDARLETQFRVLEKALLARAEGNSMAEKE